MLFVYCDMDDVITDFKKKAHALYKVDTSKAQNTDVMNELMTDFIKKGYYTELEWNPNGVELVVMLEDLERFNLIKVELLSSTGRRILTEEQRQSTIDQKKIWLANRAISWKLNIVHTTAEGRDFEAKAKFAGPGKVIIDDNINNCTLFEKAGGKSILYDGDVKKIRKFLVTMVAEHDSINSR